MGLLKYIQPTLPSSLPMSLIDQIDNSKISSTRLMVMGVTPQTSPSTRPHLYPQALQLKLYQAFIFSIPILFSIILFLLFYLFYLKRRASSSLTSPPPILSITTAQPTTHQYAISSVGLKGDLIDKLPKVIFDEGRRTWDSQCCVCLGEYEEKEELVQLVGTCRHMFHKECISHWLQSNSTCPLCRCSVFPTTNLCCFNNYNNNNNHPTPTPTSTSTNTTTHVAVTSQQQQQHQQQLEQNGQSGSVVINIDQS